jgi:hypothetical protein
VTKYKQSKTEQSKVFAEAARALECHEFEERFDTAQGRGQQAG